MFENRDEFTCAAQASNKIGDFVIISFCLDAYDLEVNVIFRYLGCHIEHRT